MSRLSSNWDIGRSTGRCAATGVELPPGSTCVAALVESEVDPSAPLVRVDFSETAWAGDARPKGVLAFWRTQVPTDGEKRRGFVDDQTLLDLFERLGGDERPHRVRFRFVLMLLLVRKRLLRVVGTSTEGAEETGVDAGIETGIETWMVLPRGASEGESATPVVNPRLGEAAMKEVTEQLGEVLDGAW